MLAAARAIPLLALQLARRDNKFSRMNSFPTEPKANCIRCGGVILLATYTRTTGRCMSCAGTEGYVPPKPSRVAPTPSGPRIAGCVQQAIYTIEEAVEKYCQADDAESAEEEEEIALILGTPRIRAKTPTPEVESILFRVILERLDSWRPTGCLCLSETPLNLGLRLLSSQSEEPLDDLLSGRLRECAFPIITGVARKLAKASLFLCGREELVRDGLVKTLRCWHDEHGVRMLLIDSRADLLAYFPDAIEELRSIAHETSITVLFPGLVGLGELPGPEPSRQEATPVAAKNTAASTAESGHTVEPF